MDTKQPEALRLAHIFEHPLPPEWSDMVAATKELRRQHTENATLQSGYAAARLEIESLKERVQQLGQLARDVNSRRVTELEAQLEAIGAGGVEPLRKRCLHQVSEPVQPVALALDAERLDYLIEQRAYVVSDPSICDGYWLHYARPNGETWVQSNEHTTPRAAIDAARAERIK